MIADVAPLLGIPNHVLSNFVQFKKYIKNIIRQHIIQAL